MLKITKGLKPVEKEGIMTYTDARGNDYVRVKVGREDFCIAAHDLTKNGKDVYFTWNGAMKLLGADGLTTLTRDQAMICMDHLSEVNDKLKEMGGDTFSRDWYWTSTEFDAYTKRAWLYYVEQKVVNNNYKSGTYRIRPTFDL